MDTQLLYWSIPFLFLFLSVFLATRLKFFSSNNINGKLPYFLGTFLLLLSISWYSVEHLSNYSEWFIISAYAVIDIIHFTIFILGATLTVIGLVLFSDFWEMQKEEILIQEQKLSLLSELQQDAREPYHLMELFNLSLKEIVANVEETVGVLFLVNKSRRQFVLAKSIGLSKENTAKLEQFTFGQNLITQSIELGEPLISGEFSFEKHESNLKPSIYKSTLVLPMISGTEKIGIIMLLSEQPQHFSRTEIKFLYPIAEWLAEKIKTTKLTRELSILTKEKDKITQAQDADNQRLFSSTASLHSSKVITSYCHSLIGIADSKSVHLLGIKDGNLKFYGGSEPILDLSENYKTALVDALNKKKPLIINQETKADDGRVYIAKSSLIYPIITSNSSDALLFIKETNAFSIDDNNLKTIEMYANLARLALQRQESLSLNITRRKGLDKVIKFLRFENSITFEKNQNYFVHNISEILPENSLAITFEKKQNGTFRANSGFNVDNDTIKKFDILPGEGILGDVNASMESIFIYGKNKIEKAIHKFDEQNRNLLHKLFGENGLPVFIAVCPIHNLNGLVGISIFCLFSISEEEVEEWGKLLTLATGLYSIRLTINQLKEQENEIVSDNDDVVLKLGKTVNRLNNHLTAIIGNAELISEREDLNGDIKNYFQTILNESEQAAQYLRDSLGKFSKTKSSQENENYTTPTIQEMISEQLKKSYISENIYQLAGTPKQLNLSMQVSEKIMMPTNKFQSFFEAVINRFAVTVDSDDVITVATHIDENFVYLDISSHHKDFPPIQNVSEIAEYLNPSDAINKRPSDRFLEFLTKEKCFYAYDKFSQIPTYISFKFQIQPSSNFNNIQKPNQTRIPRILAIDDQTVILDLIQAMCQNLGYEVDVADSGKLGIEMATKNEYDLLLTDLAMPGISGLDVSHTVKTTHPNLPIILITGWDVNLSEIELKKAGISKVLYKPFRIEQLIGIMHFYLKQSSISS